ncbi:MAG: gliding motility-associated C-terminal domain-containing protein [Cyclobacteriaceae bacterium]
MNGNPGALDGMSIVYIYRKSDNQLMQVVSLPLVGNENVPYSNVECSESFLRTSRLLYSRNIQLPAGSYDDPEGYYVAYERCCRNYLIDNIFSDVPGAGISAGQTFYLEFPPVVDSNGTPFINSTPRLFPPLRDYGCVDKFYYVDFSGVDDDGDSLVYSMVTPYSTFDTFNAIPPVPGTAPYPEVQYRPGFGPDNIMGGEPPLQISKRGLLTVTPGQIGLFVFAVKCEEYRDGIKIGEMRRDFQMLVVDGCVNNPPVIAARESGSDEYYREGQVIDFDYTDEDKCIDIEVRDIPVSGEEIENVSIRAIPINFNADLEGIEIDFSNNVPLQSADDVASFQVCFPECPYIANRPYEIGIIAMDDACPQPDLDTIVVKLNVRPPPNNRPFFENLPAVFNVEVDEKADGRYEQLIIGRDVDLDNLTLDAVPFGFRLEDYGMQFVSERNEAGRTEVRFIWDYDCQSTSFADRSSFQVQLRLDDEDQCLLSDPVRLTMNLRVNLPPNTEPELFTDRSSVDQEMVTFRHVYGEEINIDVIGRDADNDQVTITGAGLNFDFEDYDVSFSPANGFGLDEPTAPFRMFLPCIEISESDTLDLAFFIEDFDKCQVTNRDTLLVKLLVEPPQASDPVISARSLTQTQLEGERLVASIGEDVRIRIQGIDFDNDALLLRLLESDPRLEGKFTFEEVSGVQRVQSELVWIPDCDDLSLAELSEEGDFRFTFGVSDDNCYRPGEDMLTLSVSLEDIISSDEEFVPPNIFTPNGDSYNRFFALDGLDDDDRPILTGLPEDNCNNRFEEVVIYNRWGNVVYRSEDRFFRWFGENAAAGIYYYVVRFSKKDYKGSVTVRY